MTGFTTAQFLEVLHAHDRGEHTWFYQVIKKATIADGLLTLSISSPLIREHFEGYLKINLLAAACELDKSTRELKVEFQSPGL